MQVVASQITVSLAALN